MNYQLDGDHFSFVGLFVLFLKYSDADLMVTGGAESHIYLQ